MSCRTHPHLFRKVEHHPGIELTRSGSHGNAVEGGEAHRGLDTAARLQRAHRGTTAKVRHDHAAHRVIRRHGVQPLGDVLIRQAVKAVATHPRLEEAARQRVTGMSLRAPRMERGVEAGHLRYVGPDLHCAPNGGQIVRLVQRREVLERGELLQHLLVDKHRPGVVRPAVDDAMSDRPDADSLQAKQPILANGNCARQVGNVVPRVRPIDCLGTVAVSSLEMRRDANARHLALEPAPEPVALDAEELELKAR